MYQTTISTITNEIKLSHRLCVTFPTIKRMIAMTIEIIIGALIIIFVTPSFCNIRFIVTNIFNEGSKHFQL